MRCRPPGRVAAITNTVDTDDISGTEERLSKEGPGHTG